MAEKIVCNPEVFSSRAYPKKSKKICFVIMPFRSETEADKRIQDVYKHHILPVAQKCGLDCTRADDKRYFRNGKPIMEQIWKAICTADIVIGEFTTANPNVTYEAGIAHTLGKPLIGIVQDMKDVPFDYRHLRFITYTTTHDGYASLDSELETEITEYMKELDEQYPQEYLAASVGASTEELSQAQQINAVLENKLRVTEAELRTQLANKEQALIAAEAQVDELSMQVKAYGALEKDLRQQLAISRAAPPPQKRDVDVPQVGDILPFGPYQWRVLDVQGDKALLITEDIIEQRAYNESGRPTTWAKCSLRAYLNGKFLEKFHEDDQNSILSGIFLLSTEEAKDYFSDDIRRVAKFNNKAAWWWLRSSGYFPYDAAAVNRGGDVDLIGRRVNRETGGVRPALWLNL